MAGIEQDDLGQRQVAPIGERTGREEMRVVTAPDSQERRLVRAEIGVEGRIEGEIAGIVEDQVELDIVGTGAGQIGIVQRVAVGGDERRVGAIQLLAGAYGLRVQGYAAGFAVFRRRLCPVAAPRSPGIAQTFEIRVAVLADDRGDALGMGEGQAETDGGAVIEDVERVAIQMQRLGESVDDLGEGIETIGETAAWGRLGVAEAGKVGGDHPELAGQFRNEGAEHVAGAGKAVQQQKHGGVGGAGDAVEHLYVAEFLRVKLDLHRCCSSTMALAQWTWCLVRHTCAVAVGGRMARSRNG